MPACPLYVLLLVTEMRQYHSVIMEMIAPELSLNYPLLMDVG